MKFWFLIFIMPIVVFAKENTTEEEFDDPQIPHSISIEAGGSSSNSRSLFLDLDYGLNSGARLGAGVGGTRLISEQGTLNTISSRVSYQSDPLEEWSFGASFENWGARNKLMTNSFKVNVTWAPDVWEFILEPEAKVINWFTPYEDNKRYQSTAGGLHARVSFFGVSKLRLSLSSGGYRYTHSIDKIFDSGYFYEEALDLAASFPKNYFGFDASYSFSGWSLGSGFIITRYEYQETLSQTGFLRSNIDLSKSISVGAEAGRTTSEGSNSTYGSLSLSYKWR